MTRSKNNCWPNPEQELLLRASLLDGNEAIEAWNQWINTINLDHIDYGSHRLLPLLYKTLKDHKVDGPEFGRIKGVYKRTWIRNQLLFRDVMPVIQALYVANIDIMLLKGAALTIQIYNDYGARPMGDIDILVPCTDIKKTIEILYELGWNPEYEFAKGYNPLTHAVHYASQEENSLDLHWQVLKLDGVRKYEKGYWERSLEMNIGDIPVRVLCPTDQLIHACEHSIHWNLHPLLRWVADSYLILQTADIEWDHLVSHTKQLQMTLLLSKALRYLKEGFDLSIPECVLQSLETTPTSTKEYWRYRLAVYKPMPVFGVFIRQFFRYLTSFRGKYPFPGFLRYLQQRWSVPYLWQVPFEGVLRGVRKIKIDIMKFDPESLLVPTIFKKK